MDEKVTGLSVNYRCKKLVWVRELLSKLIKFRRGPWPWDPFSAEYI